MNLFYLSYLFLRSGKCTANSSSRITNTRTSVRDKNNDNINIINTDKINSGSNKNNKDSNNGLYSNRGSNQSFAGSSYHSENSSEEYINIYYYYVRDNLTLVKPKEVVGIEQEEKKSNSETDLSKPPVYIPKNKNISFLKLLFFSLIYVLLITS